MDVANLNPMVAPTIAPNSGGDVIPKNLNSGSGSTVIYIVVVLVILLLLVAVGYFAMKSSKQETIYTDSSIKYGEDAGDVLYDDTSGLKSTEEEVVSEDLMRARELAYIAYHTERGNPPELNEDGSLVSDIVRGPQIPDPEPETIRFTEEGSAVENYIIMPDNIDYEYQTYAYNPQDTSLNGSAITFDYETNKCPDGTLDCLYYTRVEDGRVKSISDKDGNDLIEKFMDDLWNGKLLLLETPESVEMMKAYELNEKRQLMRDGKVLKPGVDLNVGQYLLIFSVMYRETGLLRPKIIYDFPPKIASAKPPSENILPPVNLPPTTAITLATPNATDAAAKKVGDVTEDVSSVEREMADIGSEVEQKPKTETPPIQTTLNDISAKITFVSPSVEQETPTLDETETDVKLVTPVTMNGVIRERVKL